MQRLLRLSESMACHAYEGWERSVSAADILAKRTQFDAAKTTGSSFSGLAATDCSRPGWSGSGFRYERCAPITSQSCDERRGGLVGETRSGWICGGPGPSKFGRTKPNLSSKNNEGGLPHRCRAHRRKWRRAGRSAPQAGSIRRPARQGCPSDAGTGCIAFGVGSFLSERAPSVPVEYPETWLRFSCMFRLRLRTTSTAFQRPSAPSPPRDRLTFGRDQRSIIKGKCNLHMIRSSYADKVRPKVFICESALFQTNQ
jgi:hypothetical protein